MPRAATPGGMAESCVLPANNRGSRDQPGLFQQDGGRRLRKGEPLRNFGHTGIALDLIEKFENLQHPLGRLDSTMPGRTVASRFCNLARFEVVGPTTQVLHLDLVPAFCGKAYEPGQTNRSDHPRHHPRAIQRPHSRLEACAVHRRHQSQIFRPGKSIRIHHTACAPSAPRLRRKINREIDNSSMRLQMVTVNRRSQVFAQASWTMSARKMTRKTRCRGACPLPTPRRRKQFATSSRQ